MDKHYQKLKCYQANYSSNGQTEAAFAYFDVFKLTKTNHQRVILTKHFPVMNL